MRVEEELSGLSPDKDMFLTIGVFDGVHLGHKYLISRVVSEARQHGLLSGVVTFRQHPLEILSPETILPYLTDVDTKISLLKNEGVDEVVPLTVTSELIGLSAKQFVGLLKKHLRLNGLIIGPDFVLGRNREGDADTLRRLGEEIGFSVTAISPLEVNGEVASSTLIRAALAEGDMKRVSNLTGRPFSLRGQVTTGEGRGATLGFPTTNLAVSEKQAIPADGVYATLTHIDCQVYKSVTNIGQRPTFDGSGRTIETHIVNFQGDLYQQSITVDFIERLRGEKKFDSVEDLKKQITQDITRGESILSARGER